METVLIRREIYFQWPLPCQGAKGKAPCLLTAVFQSIQFYRYKDSSLLLRAINSCQPFIIFGEVPPYHIKKSTRNFVR